MELMDAMRRRRSIRKYLETPVPEDSLKMILRAGLLAPTSRNKRPWEFYVVKDREVLERLSKAKWHGSALLAGCDSAIAVFADSELSDAWIEDSSIALAYMDLAAASLGVGSCWVQMRMRKDENGGDAEDNVRRILGVKEPFQIVGILALGMPAEKKDPYDPDELKWKKVHWPGHHPTRQVTEGIREDLFRLQDKKYRDFQKKLIPSVDPETVIGVRTPELRKFAKELAREQNVSEFLEDLPHRYFDENQLHAFIISEMKDWDQCMAEVERFLPFIDNWATCDQLSPKTFKKNREKLPDRIWKWIGSGDTYSIRFGVGMLMQHFLDEDFERRYPEKVAQIRSEEYYVNMMTAWYFATGLAKQYDEILPFIEERRLDTRTHNKAIQKALESFRVTPEHKEYLRSLKIPARRQRKCYNENE